MPGATVVAEANRLVDTPESTPATLGLDVQAMTTDVSSATGAPLGVVVSRVNHAGAAAGQVIVGDVIDAIDGRPLESRQRWDVRTARLSEGETVSAARSPSRRSARGLGRGAGSACTGVQRRRLGLTLRARPGMGAEVVRVDRGIRRPIAPASFLEMSLSPRRRSRGFHTRADHTRLRRRGQRGAAAADRRHAR